jgi:MYXO-CTERM domain-containing protein
MIRVRGIVVGSDILLFNSATGASTLFASQTHPAFFAIAGVPEPSSLIPAAWGLLGVLALTATRHARPKREPVTRDKICGTGVSSS